MIKVIIVDDHALFRLGTRYALSDGRFGVNVVGEAGDGKELFLLLKTTDADLILLDLSLPDMSGIDIARRLRKEYPNIKILIVTVDNTSENIQQLMEIGINGFLSKQQTSGNELPNAVQSIMDGTEYFGKDIASIMYNIYVTKKDTTKDFTEQFTEREMEVIMLSCNALAVREIAEKLDISPRTVDTHKNNIFRKMGINSSLEMVQYAFEHGII
jgi:DNA-binding NarL/FixJ family response regulator